MGMDIDAVFAHKALENLDELISNLPHGERGEIADDITAFENAMCKKYNHKSAFNRDKQSVSDEVKEIRLLAEQLQLIALKMEADE